MAGQARLFHVEGDDAEPPLRYRVGAPGHRRGAALASLPLAAAQARALAVQGYRAVITATDGTSAEVRRDADGFTVIPLGLTTWPDQCRRLLTEHG